MIRKLQLFYCHTYQFDFRGDAVGGWVCVHSTYGGLPGVCLTLICITGKDFTNAWAIMGCLQVIWGLLHIFMVIWAHLHWFKPIWGQ